MLAVSVVMYTGTYLSRTRKSQVHGMAPACCSEGDEYDLTFMFFPTTFFTP